MITISGLKVHVKQGCGKSKYRHVAVEPSNTHESIVYKIVLPPTRKKGALGFFALRKIKFWEKALFFRNSNREN